jgi:hypothetical protein
VAALSDFTISYRLDGSEIDYAILSKTVENAFEACRMLLATDPYISDARVIRAQTDVAIEIEHDRLGLHYVPIAMGSTAQGIFCRAVNELGNGNR